jgi:hypothetical protein
MVSTAMSIADSADPRPAQGFQVPMIEFSSGKVLEVVQVMQQFLRKKQKFGL